MRAKRLPRTVPYYHPPIHGRAVTKNLLAHLLGSIGVNFRNHCSTPARRISPCPPGSTRTLPGQAAPFHDLHIKHRAEARLARSFELRRASGKRLRTMSFVSPTRNRGALTTSWPSVLDKHGTSPQIHWKLPVSQVTMAWSRFGADMTSMWCR